MDDFQRSKLEKDLLKIVTGKELIVDKGNSTFAATPGTSGGTTNNTFVESKGWEYLHSKYPDEFEYYSVAFELVNRQNYTQDFFSFPILPSSISIPKHVMTNIKKTFAGIVVTQNSTFVPYEITLSGNFGRKLKRIMAFNPTTKNVIPGATAANMPEYLVKPVFNSDYKTGYACTKMLEDIILQSQKFSSGDYSPVKLYLHNLTFNQNVLVEVMDYRFFMNKELNRIWEYEITLKVIGEAKNFHVNEKYALKQLLDYNKIQSAGNALSTQSNKTIKDKVKNKLYNGKQTKLEKVLSTEIGKRAYQVAQFIQPNILKTALQLSEKPQDIEFFLLNIGNTILVNNGRVL